MTLIQAIIMGFIQGLTEFLPVSSSGHLALFKILFGVETETGIFFDVMLHVGTLAAIAVVLVVIGIVCAMLGIAFIFVVKVAAAIIIAMVLQKLLLICFARIGETFRIPALQDMGTIGKLSSFLSWICAVYICFVKW